jgi:MFS family permease
VARRAGCLADRARRLRAGLLPDRGAAAGAAAARRADRALASGLAAALGSLLASRLGDIVPERRLLPALLVLSSLCVVALAAARSVWPYGILRFLQVLCIAPVFPLVVARIAQSAGGAAIGVINSARIGAAFLGPVVATTVLAWSSPTAVYGALGLLGLACAPLARLRLATGRPERGA